VAQNAKFELAWLDRCGLDLHDVLVWDTMLAEWVVLGNRKLPKDLGSTCKRYGIEGKEDVVGGMIKLGINPLSIPKKLLESYCFEDVRATKDLFLAQRQSIIEREQLHLVYSRCLLTPVLTDIEKQGIYLDSEEVYKEYESVTAEKQEAERKLEEFGTINWNSRQQVAELLYDKLGFEELKDRKGNPIRTESGQRGTNVATLSGLRANSKEQREFLEAYAKLAKLNTKLSKTLEFFRTICAEYGSTFYGVFNQGSTGTHRLSSSGRPVEGSDGVRYSAQLQNIPREYKRFVKPREEGWSIVESDGSQIEFRVAADMGNDEVAYDEISNGVDIHSFTAQVLTEAGEPTSRQGAKASTFAPLYGGGGKTKAQNAYCEFFKNKYQGIFKTQTSWTHDVLRSGELRTPYGMIFYWPGTTVRRSGYIDNTTSIFNYPIQGMATAEIIPIVLISLWHKFKGHNIRIILTVHDSIVMEVGPDVDREWLNDTIARAFTEDVYNYLDRVYNYTMWVPLGMETKEGPAWGSGTGRKAKMYPDERRGEIVWQ
jgi:DNA polymerase I-like protein with 3'-5' exonuclease and polymerase domains